MNDLTLVYLNENIISGLQVCRQFVWVFLSIILRRRNSCIIKCICIGLMGSVMVVLKILCSSEAVELISVKLKYNISRYNHPSRFIFQSKKGVIKAAPFSRLFPCFFMFCICIFHIELNRVIVSDGLNETKTFCLNMAKKDQLCAMHSWRKNKFWRFYSKGYYGNQPRPFKVLKHWRQQLLFYKTSASCKFLFRSVQSTKVLSVNSCFQCFL